MRHLLLILFILSSYIGIAQKNSDQSLTQPNTTYGIQYFRGGFPRGLFFPSGCGRPDDTYDIPKNARNLGAIYLDTCGDVVFKYNPVNGWDTLQGSSGGGGGIAAYLNNLGNGFKIGKANSTNLKTFFPGYGSKIDSTSNVNGLTVAADTNAIATKAYVDRKQSVVNNYGDTAVYNITNNYNAAGDTTYTLDTTFTTNGNFLTIAIPLNGNTVTSFRTGNTNGSIDYYEVKNDTLFVYYINAPTGQVNYQLNGRKIGGLGFLTNWGVLTNLTPTATNITALRNLNARTYRGGYSQSGATPAYKVYTDSNFKVVPNYNFAVSVSGNQTPFPTDTNSVRSTAHTFFTTKDYTNVTAYVGPNEVNNWGYSNAYWSGNAKDALNFENIVADEVHKSTGKQFLTGGFTGDYMLFPVVEDFELRGFHDSAESFRQRTQLPATVYNWRTVTSRQPQIKFTDTLISGYAASNKIDFVNIHFYVDYDSLDNGRTFKEIARFFQRATGKAVVTNEIGQHTTSTAAVMQLLQAAYELKMKYALWYSGEATYSLVNNDGTRRVNGDTFRNFISMYQ